MPGGAAFWDRVAPAYDSRTAWLERRFMAASREWVGARAHGDTLEVGVGTGANLPYYSNVVRLTAIDASAVMVEQAHRRAVKEQRDVRFGVAVGEALPYADESFDSVVATFTMCCVHDDVATLREALRVLRPGGSLVLADHVVGQAWTVRALQRAVELVTVPAQGEHFTRRPLELLRTLGDGVASIVESERLSHGVIERVHARRR